MDEQLNSCQTRFLASLMDARRPVEQLDERDAAEAKKETWSSSREEQTTVSSSVTMR